MELRELEYFVAVAEEANFTRAAAKLRVAQPGVSARIRQLERELGHELLDRTGRTVRLTEIGAAVLPYARAALAAAAGARLAVDELTGLLRGHVAMGMVTPYSTPEFDLPGLLARFHHEHPAVTIALSEGTAERLVESLQAGRLEVALIGLGAKLPPGMTVHVLVDEPLVAVVHADDALAVATAVPLAALEERTLITLSRGTGMRSVIDEASSRDGLQLNIAFEASHPYVVAQLAERGLGVGILPESAARAHPALHVVSIIRPQLRGRLALAWRSEGPSSPAIQALVRCARAAAPSGDAIGRTSSSPPAMRCPASSRRRRD